MCSPFWYILSPIAFGLLGIFKLATYLKKLHNPQTTINHSPGLSLDILDPILKTEYFIQQSMRGFIKDLIQMLNNFSIPAKLTACIPSRSVTIIRLEVPSMRHAERISRLYHEIAVCMCADSSRVFYNGTQVTIEIANKTRSVIRIKEILKSTILLNQSNSVISLGLNTRGTQVNLNVSNLKRLVIAGDSQVEKQMMIECILLSSFYQKAKPINTVILDPHQMYTNYNLAHIKCYQGDFDVVLRKLKGPLLLVIHDLDYFYSSLTFQDFLKQSGDSVKIIASVSNPEVCSSFLQDHFVQRILFRMTKGRKVLAAKNLGIEGLLYESDMLYVDENGVTRIQTPIISSAEAVRVLKAVSELQAGSVS